MHAAILYERSVHEGRDEAERIRAAARRVQCEALVLALAKLEVPARVRQDPDADSAVAIDTRFGRVDVRFDSTFPNDDIHNVLVRRTDGTQWALNTAGSHYIAQDLFTRLPELAYPGDRMVWVVAIKSPYVQHATVVWTDLERSFAEACPLCTQTSGALCPAPVDHMRQFGQRCAAVSVDVIFGAFPVLATNQPNSARVLDAVNAIVDRVAYDMSGGDIRIS